MFHDEWNKRRWQGCQNPGQDNHALLLLDVMVWSRLATIMGPSYVSWTRTPADVWCFTYLRFTRQCCGNQITELEGIENISHLANYAEDESDIMADWNNKQTLIPQCVMMELSCRKDLKAVMCWVWKKMHRRRQLDMSEVIVPSINPLICQIAAANLREVCR